MEHEHCWCQRVFVNTFPAASNSPQVAHDQCCVCGDRRIADVKSQDPADA